MTTESLPQTLLEAVTFFADETRAHDFLVGMRWGAGVTCPHCESKEVGALSVSTRTNAKGKTLTRRVWNCKGCKRQFTVKVGTIFEDSPLSLTKWLPAVWMIVNAKNGISSYEISRSLGITQKSAWFMLHRIRAAMHDGIFNLAGEVEADETFIGAKARNMRAGKRKISGTGPIAMTAVMGLLERSHEKGESRVKVGVVGTRKKAELQAAVRNNVVAGSSAPKFPLSSFPRTSSHIARLSSISNYA